MALNNFQPHVLIIPEDPALHDICTGFERCVSRIAKGNAIRVDPNVAGRDKLRKKLYEEELEKLRRYPKRLLVLVRDFDGDPECGHRMLDSVDSDLQERIFIVGPLNEAEDLRKQMRVGGCNTLEAVGESIYDNCRDAEENRNGRIDQLKHLLVEFARLRHACGQFLGF